MYIYSSPNENVMRWNNKQTTCCPRRNPQCNALTCIILSCAVWK